MAAVADSVVAEHLAEVAVQSRTAAARLSGTVDGVRLDRRSGHLDVDVAGSVVHLTAWDPAPAEAFEAMVALERVHVHASVVDGWVVLVASSASWSYALHCLPRTP